jgi:hypothetical protein
MNNEIMFKEAMSEWGSITHAIVRLPNTKRRWWQLWKRRYINVVLDV